MAEAELREQVRQRYADAAVHVTSGAGGGLDVVDVASSCCATEAQVDETFGAGLYGEEDRDGLPADALAASLGCGNPMVVAQLQAGERVLDLGSGGGSTYCCPLVAWARPGSPTGST